MTTPSASPLHEKEFHNILLWMPNWVGDVILVLPVLRSLRQRFPNSRFTAVTRQPSYDLLFPIPEIDSVIKIPAKMNKTAWGRIRFAINLRKYSFDLGVVFPNSIGTALLLFLTGAQNRIGYKTEGRGIFLTIPVPVTDRIKRTEYRVEYFFKILAPLNLKAPGMECTSIFHNNSGQAVREFMSRIGLGVNEALVVVHPGTSKPQRAWQAERFGILCQKLIREHKARIVLLGNEHEAGLIGKIIKFCPEDSAHAVTEWGLKDIASLLGRSRLFIGNDSGMMHLAAMVGTPVVGIFGPGSPSTTGPFIEKSKQEIVTKNYSCSPCRQRFFKECKPSPHQKPYCLEDISVKDVADAVSRLLERTVDHGSKTTVQNN